MRKGYVVSSLCTPPPPFSPPYLFIYYSYLNCTQSENRSLNRRSNYNLKLIIYHALTSLLSQEKNRNNNKKENNNCNLFVERLLGVFKQIVQEEEEIEVGHTIPLDSYKNQY